MQRVAPLVLLGLLGCSSVQALGHDDPRGVAGAGGSGGRAEAGRGGSQAGASLGGSGTAAAGAPGKGGASTGGGGTKGDAAGAGGHLTAAAGGDAGHEQAGGETIAAGNGGAAGTLDGSGGTPGDAGAAGSAPAGGAQGGGGLGSGASAGSESSAGGAGAAGEGGSPVAAGNGGAGGQAGESPTGGAGGSATLSTWKLRVLSTVGSMSGLVFVSPQRGYASSSTAMMNNWYVGLFVTDDGGKTWSPRPDVDGAGHGLAVLPDGKRLWVAGFGGADLWRSDDGGDTITPIEIGTSRPLFPMFWDTQVGFQRNDSSNVTERTTDGGVNWTTVDCGVLSVHATVARGATTGWAVGAGATGAPPVASRTTDLGASWEPHPVGEAETDGFHVGFYAVAALGEDEAWVGGQRQRLHHTVDGGANWQKHELPVADGDGVTVVGVAAHGAHVFVVGNRNVGYSDGGTVIYESINGGQTFVETRFDLGKWGNGVTLMGDTKVFVFGSNGYLLEAAL